MKLKPPKITDRACLIAIAVLAVCSLWLYFTMDANCEAARVEAENLRVCRELADRVKKMRQRPAQTGTEARSATALALQIENSAKTANIPQAQIVQIDPQPARRLGSSPYKEQPTRVELRDVGMSQLILFIDGLLAGQPGADLAELRLSASEGSNAPAASGGTSERWEAELVLTDTFFSP